MIDIKQIENQILEKEQDVSNHSMSYLLLQEIKASAKRWFIIAIIELAILLSIIGGVIWYVGLPLV